MKIIINIYFFICQISIFAQPSDIVISFGMSQSAVNDWKVGETAGYEVINSLKLNTTVPVDTFRLRFVLDYGWLAVALSVGARLSG